MWCRCRYSLGLLLVTSAGLNLFIVISVLTWVSTLLFMVSVGLIGALYLILYVRPHSDWLGVILVWCFVM